MKPRNGDGVPYPAPPTVPIKACPIETTLQSLGRKWTITILRDIAFFPRASFSLIMRRNVGLRQRTLSLRLRQLEAEELVRKVVPAEDARHPYYELSPKGLEVWPILSSLFQFGIRNHAETVFEDRRPRDLADVYPHDVPLLLGPLAAYAQSAGAVATGRGPPGRTAGAGRTPPTRS